MPVSVSYTHLDVYKRQMFEHTELFARVVGDGTDVVQKEMYTFEDKGGRSITCLLYTSRCV